MWKNSPWPNTPNPLEVVVAGIPAAMPKPVVPGVWVGVPNTFDTLPKGAAGRGAPNPDWVLPNAVMPVEVAGVDVPKPVPNVEVLPKPVCKFFIECNFTT